ncbi:hypothetical protein [uncultured Arcobacter sp.]|uniref:hypothetical protein n=1 Tax=uncultured Arcobacter sp. TaxID=165434 RepID=UPI002608464E|nr:hypothetical protein [uncultured Arcobacter sp.]
MALGRQFVVRVDGVRKLNKKFKAIKDFARFKAGKLTRSQAMIGASIAASIAPRKSGSLIAAIGYGQERNKTWSVISRQPKNQRNRPYHMWMHGLDGKNIAHMIKTGEAKYMFKMYDTLEKEYPGLINKGLQKELNK